jgi:transcriptional regulator with XRE-family HTH domain
MAWPPPDDVTEARIHEAWALRRQGYSQHTIAERLGMTQSGVSRLLARSRAREAAKFAKQSAAYKADQQQILEFLLEEVVGEWRNSKQPRKRAAVKRPGDSSGPADEVQTTEIVEQIGDTAYIAEARGILKDMRSLAGLDVMPAVHESMTSIAEIAADIARRGEWYERERQADGVPADPPAGDESPS